MARSWIRRHLGVSAVADKDEYNRRYHNIQEEARRVHFFKARLLALQRVSGKRVPECVKCGEKNILVLTLNHLKGRPENEKVGQPDAARISIRVASGQREVDDLDVRCYNCNFLYEYERKEGPGAGVRKMPVDWQKIVAEIIG